MLGASCKDQVFIYLTKHGRDIYFSSFLLILANLSEENNKEKFYFFGGFS
jgi:hypothetical protein